MSELRHFLLLITSCFLFFSCSWWLRSPSFPQWTAQYVRYNGNPEKVNYNDDGNVDLGMHGIVPAMCF